MTKKTPGEELKDMGADISVNGGAYVSPDSPEAKKQVEDMVKRGMGHNSGEKPFPTKSETDARLRSFIERIERLNGERAELGEDIKEIYGELSANGYEKKIVRKIVRMRAQDVEKRQEEDALVQVYKLAVGLD